MRALINALLILSFPSIACASSDCKEPRARYEDIGCTLESLESADKKLNDAYKILLASLDQNGKTKLIEAQRAWIRFRDADTTFAYHNSGEGGSLGGLMSINHKLDLTLERTRQLQDFSNSR